MSELGNIQPIQRMACAHCRALLPEKTLAAALEDDAVRCPACGGSIRLPAEVVERHRQKRFLGRNLDITG